MLLLARSTIFNSTTFSLSRVKAQRDRPCGDYEHAKAISLASAAPSKMHLRTVLGECLRVNAASKPYSTKRWCRPRYHDETGVERLHDAAVAPTLSRCRNISFQQDACLENRGHRPFAGTGQGFQFRASFLLIPRLKCNEQNQCNGSLPQRY